MSLSDKKISFSVKQLLVYGGIPLVLVIAGIVIFSQYQIAIYKKGSSGAVTAENSPKRIEYQGQRYMLDGDFCKKSTGQRIPITVVRTNGADLGEGANGNTMYAIDTKDSPEYIDTKADPKTAPETRNCWMKESSYQP